MGPSSPSGARTAGLTTWDPKEIIQIIDEKRFNDRNPYFLLDVKALRDARRYHETGPVPVGSPPRPSKQAKWEETRATCALTIWEGQGQKPIELVQETVACRIQPQTRLPNTGERFAKIELDHPFRVYCRQLAPRSPKPPVAQRFSMQLTLQAEDLDTPWPPMDLNKIPPPERDSAIDIDGSVIRYPFLVTSYSRFPQCPAKEDEALLHLTVLQDGKQLKPRLCLQIDARWLEPSGPADTFDAWTLQKRGLSQKRRAVVARKAAPSDQQRPSKPRRLPSPPPSSTLVLPDLDKLVRTTWEVTHEKISVRKNTFRGFICPLCLSSDGTPGKAYFSSDIYWWHLKQTHDNFKFQVTTKYQEGKIRTRVKVSVEDTYATESGGGRLTEGENFTKQPKTAGVRETLVLKNFTTFFDLQQYLQRDRGKSWSLRIRADTLTGRNSRSGSAFDSSGRASPAILPDLTRPASQVPDLVRPRRKKYAVPPAPDGVTFFSLRVKRPLREGELLSESDDEIDDEWLLEKQEARIDGFDDFTPEEKSFIKCHDRHMLKENINSNIHYREALVRFCRINSRWLRQKDMRREFAKKLTALQLEGVIKIQQVFEYMDIIDNPQSSSDKMDVDADVDEKLPKTEIGQSPKETSRRFYSRCAICRDPIVSLEDIKRCSDLACLNDCHLGCADLLFGPQQSDLKNARCRCCTGEEISMPSKGDPGPAQIDRHTARSQSISREAATAHETSSPISKNATQTIELDYSDPESFDLLSRLAPDHLSRLPNGKRATTPKRTQDYPTPSDASRMSGSVAEPIALDMDEDFPVGRDRSRIRQQMQQGAVPSFEESYDGLNESPRKVMGERQQQGYDLQLSQSYHGYTSAEIASEAGSERPQRPRRPHEL